jgi:ribosome-associated heat shock protein Hsp15
VSRRDTPKRDDDEEVEDAHRVRLDQWLWAARFFKTRSLAAEAVDGGKVEVGGERAKRARLVRPGDIVKVRQGPIEIEMVVKALAARRGSASIAQALYEETPEGKAVRERTQLQMKLAHVQYDFAEGKPDKKQRREIDRWKGRE